jgi:hypothetical protein
VPLGLVGVLDTNKGAGLALLAPGGLFEVVCMPIWLIAKGFNPPTSEQQLIAPTLATTS